MTVEGGKAFIDPDLLEGIKVVLSDDLSQGVLRQVVRRLSVHEHEIAIKLEVQSVDVAERLNILVENDLVFRHEGELGALPLFSPSAKGVRVYRGLASM